MTVSGFSNNYLKDWDDIDYTSFLDSFFHIMEDNMFWMDTPYVMIYLNNEDDNFYEDGDPASSLLTQVRWDWAETN